MKGRGQGAETPALFSLQRLVLSQQLMQGVNYRGRTDKENEETLDECKSTFKRKAATQDYTHRPGDMLLFYVKPAGLARLNAS